MSNTLTNLIPDAYAALDVVSRELTGFIPAVSRDPKADQVAVGQTLRIEQAPANGAAGNVTAAMALPSAADQTIGNVSLTISKSRYAPFSWSGEEQRAVNAGPGFLTIKQDQIAQAMRALINEMEADIWAAAYKGSSRAYGTAGTNPFATNLDPLTYVRQILDDNGTPTDDRHLVMNTTAGGGLRRLTQLTQVNTAGDPGMLRQGVLGDLFGFMLHESAQISAVTKGTGSSYNVDLVAGYAAGTTTVHVEVGTGTILAGDIITNDKTGRDTNKYVVNTGFAGDGDGDIVLGKPGTRVAWVDNDPLTIGNNYTPNMAFRRNAILLATRLPAVPQEGDLATDRTVITDPRTGISFELAVYPGYRMNVYHVSVAWGVTAVKSEHIATLIG